MRYHYSHIEDQMQTDGMAVIIKVVFPLCPTEMNTLKSPLKDEVEHKLLKNTLNELKNF